MGVMLIILEVDEFYVQFVRYVKYYMLEVNVLVEDEKLFQEYFYLCMFGKCGLMIEVGV